jgi:hypothetical protein
MVFGVALVLGAVFATDFTTVAIGALPGLFGVFGLLLLVAGVWHWVRLKRFLRVAQRTEGRVVAVVQEKRKRLARYFIDVAFTDAQQQTVVFRPSLSTDQPAFQENDTVPVLFHPQQPQQARVHEFWHLWFWPVFLLTLGGLMAGIGGWVLVSYVLAVT